MTMEGKEIHNHFEKDSNCQVFQGPITNCVFAMPGSTVNMVKKDEPAQPAVNSPKSGSIPNPLNTPQAQKLWDIAKAEGWVDENLQPLISQPKAAILASVMADILRLSPRWQAFEELWGINDLATKLSISQNCNYYSSLLKTFEDKLT